MVTKINGAVLITFLALAISVNADVITVNVTGVVDSVTVSGDFTFPEPITQDQTVNGFCVYDTITPDLDTSTDNHGLYNIDALSMTIGPYSFIHEATSEHPQFQVWKGDWVYLASTDYASTYYNQSPQAWPYVYVTLLDLFNVQSPGPDDHLPTSFPDISFFYIRNKFEVALYDGDDSFAVRGHLTSIEAVPEPATCLLFLTSTLFLLKRGQNRKEDVD